MLLTLAHAGHDIGLHHTALILAGLVVGYFAAVLVRKAQESRR